VAAEIYTSMMGTGDNGASRGLVGACLVEVFHQVTVSTVGGRVGGMDWGNLANAGK
jgi:hypothetical protein